MTVRSEVLNGCEKTMVLVLMKWYNLSASINFLQRFKKSKLEIRVAAILQRYWAGNNGFALSAGNIQME